MTDPCQGCDFEGNMEGCQAEACFNHEAWYVKQVQSQLQGKLGLQQRVLDGLGPDQLRSFSDMMEDYAKIARLEAQLKEKEADLFSALKEIERRGKLYSEKFEECSEARIVVEDVLSLIEHSEGIKVHDDFGCGDVDWQTLIEKNHFRTLCPTEPNGEIAWDWDIDKKPQPTESEEDPRPVLTFPKHERMFGR